LLYPCRTTCTALALIIIGLTGCDTPVLSNSTPEKQAASSPVIGVAKVAAAPGRVEGRDDTVEVGASADGVLRAVQVREGQHVKSGQLLGELDCIDRRASIGVAEAEITEAASKLAVIERGPREDDLAAGVAHREAAEAELTEAATYLSRMEALAKKDEIPKLLYDQAVRRKDTATAQVREANAQIDKLKNGATQEDRSQARAVVASAKQRLSQTKAKVEQCQILSPQNGVILRVHARPGEAYSTSNPRPLFEITDDSQIRIRAEIDQQDRAAISVGQNAEVNVPEINAVCPARVARIAERMGRQRIYRDDAPEPKDRDVEEAILILGKCSITLPIGLRVTVVFENTERDPH
jgi:multidrug resistance efflux pump